MTQKIRFFDYRHIVVEEEVDELEHAGNLAYLKWMQAAAIAHSDVAGWTTARYFERQAGWVVRSHQIEYLQSASAGDEIIVRTWIADMKRISSLRRYRVYRAGDRKLLAEGATNWAFIDFKSRRLIRIPEEVVSAFEVFPDGPPMPSSLIPDP